VFTEALHHDGILGSGGTSPPILNFINRCKWVISFTPRLLYPEECAAASIRYEVG